MRLKSLALIGIFVIGSSAFCQQSVTAPNGPFKGKVVCTKVGSEGSKVVVTFENTPTSHYPVVQVDTDMIYHTDLADEPLTSKSHDNFRPSQLKLTTDASGNRHIEGKESYHGACLGGCPATVFALDVTPENNGSYTVKKVQFSEVSGKVEQKLLSSFSKLTCVDSN